MKEIATFAAGCFWAVEDRFRHVPGVISTMVGYSGGMTSHPTYEQVCSGTSGHAETVQVEYDSDQISYDELLNVFWSLHNPTLMNSQGAYSNWQYRSVIFYHNEEQLQKAIASKEALKRSGKYVKEIMTEILPATDFYRAENYHQQYIEKQK